MVRMATMAWLCVMALGGAVLAEEKPAATPGATSETTSSSGAYRMECKKGDEVRKVEVISEKGPDSTEPPCRVQYTKGETVNERLYTSQAQAGFCEEKAKALVERHTTEWGFTCEPMK